MCQRRVSQANTGDVLMSDIKLGTRVRFSKYAQGWRVVKTYGGDRAREVTRDPRPLTTTYTIIDTAAARHRAETATDNFKFGLPGTWRYVMVRDVRQPDEYELPNEGIIVGKTFRYEGEVVYDDGWMIGVCKPGTYSPATRVPLWEVKQALNRRAILVPLDAIEIVEDADVH